ncbi:MAG: hypothetical protein KKE16_01010 [Firmicutes bacterium]|nr:hypothetical protein [Bacillota bacterium]
MSKDELKEERMKILELLTKGVISADEAEKLLSALGETSQTETFPATQKKGPFRMLKINVDSADGDVVRVELPIEFAKLLKSKKLNVGNLDDMDIDVDALIQMINSGAIGEIVNIKSADGDTVKIVVE